MSVDNVSHRRQPDAHPFNWRLLAGLSTHELLENTPLLTRRHPNALVANGDGDFVTFAARRDPHPFPRARVLHGVIEQVPDGACQRFGIDLNRIIS